MPQFDYEMLVNLAEFACARCWKQKKKCDKAAPQCGRCSIQAAVCVYSDRPPKECIVTTEPIKTSRTPRQLLAGGWVVDEKGYVPLYRLNQANQSALPPSDSSSTHLIRLSSQVSYETWDEQFASLVRSIITASGRDAESVCRGYFENFHPWVDFISELEFWLGFSSPASRPEFSTLLLNIYLVTYGTEQESSQADILDPVYSLAKSTWSVLQNVQEPSIVLIQAGLLLATYENCQSLAEASRSTITACAELGYRMGLHKSVLRNSELDLYGPNELKQRRRTWWGIVIVERLLAAKDLGSGYVFATPHPTPDDYLPWDHNASFIDIMHPTPVATVSKYTSEPGDISFPEVSPFATVVQACYLLGRVMNYMKSDALPFEQQEKESIFLSKTIQKFMTSLLLHAEGSAFHGHYCTPFILALITLTTLHRHELNRGGDTSFENYPVATPPRPVVILQTLSRMFQEMTEKLRPSEEAAFQMPCFQIYTAYWTAWLHIKFGDKSNELEWAERYRNSLSYLQIVKRKWRVAKVALNEIAEMQHGTSGSLA